MSARTQLRSPARRQPPTGSGAAPAPQAPGLEPPSVAHREIMIREAAYFRAEHRAFAPGRELEDWFAAERDIDKLLAQAGVTRTRV